LDDRSRVQTRCGKAKSNYVAKLARIDDKDFAFKAKADVTPFLVISKRRVTLSRVSNAASAAASRLRRLSRQHFSRKPHASWFYRQATMGWHRTLRSIDVGEGGNTGLITYMRTDSTTFQNSPQRVRQYIAKRYGSDFVPELPRIQTAPLGRRKPRSIRPRGVRDPEKSNPFSTPHVQVVSTDLAALRLLADGNGAV